MMRETSPVDDTESENMTETDATMTEVSKPEKPRGKCTGCDFDYQLGTARTGEHKGKLVIRKHNSRTGPGLCSGAQKPPEPTYEELEGAAASDVVGVAPGGTPITVTRLDVDGAPVGEPFDAVGAITLCPSPVDPFTAPAVVVSDTPHDVVPGPGGTLVLPTDWSTAVMPPVSISDPNASRYEQDDNPGTVVSVSFTAPAPASDIPESMTTVSGQPEPDRDRWGRYLIMGQAHTRATTFAKLGANTKAIGLWNERNVIRGLTLRPDLLMLANGLEVKRDRDQLNSIASQAKDAAGSKVAANIGTAYHAFSERIDAGLMTLEDVPHQYRARVQQYITKVADAGLTTRPEWIERTTAVRADQISAPLPVAGTLDRIFQLPDGSLVIGDLKTGSDLSYGEMEIEVQLALYAHGVNTHGLFDWNTKTWQTLNSLPERSYGVLRVRTDIAIVVHLPADGDGCTLYVADIERGWRDAQRLGPLQTSLKEKKRFRTLMASDLAPRPAPVEQGEVAQYLAAQPAPVIEPPDSHWEHAKHLFSTAPDQARIAELYQYAMDSGLFHTDQLAVLVGLGKDRLNALARQR